MRRNQLYDILKRAASCHYDTVECAAVVRMIMGRIFNISRMDIALEPDGEITVDAVQVQRVVDQLRTGRPVQYITGIAEFSGLELNVDQSVLIPRPETEYLVRLLALQAHGNERILDLGTGSGAIALALARMVPGSEVHAVDISQHALDTATANARRNGADVQFHLADMLLPLDCWNRWGCGYFDVMVSNPPYVPESELEATARHVRDFEPLEAIFVPDGDPLLFYRKIAGDGLHLLKEGGTLWLEIYSEFGPRVTRLLEDSGYSAIELRQDIAGRDRIIKCVRP